MASPKHTGFNGNAVGLIRRHYGHIDKCTDKYSLSQWVIIFSTIQHPIDVPVNSNE